MFKTKLIAGVSTIALATIAGAMTVTSVSADEVKEGENTYYVVETGDTLSKISQKYNVDFTVVHANNEKDIDNADLIYVGQKFLVQGKDFDKTKSIAYKAHVQKQADLVQQNNTSVKKASTTKSVEKDTTTKAVESTQTQEATKPVTQTTSSNGLRYTGYSSIQEARAHRVNVEHGGNYYAYTGLNYSYIGGYGFAKSTWIMLCNRTGTSTTDFSPAHQDLLADELVRMYFGGDWGNVPRTGGW